MIGAGPTDASGRWNITSTALKDGVHSVTAKATDLAGNVSLVSAALAVTIDTVAPAEKASIVAMTAADSGIAGDFITNSGAAGRTVSGARSAALATDEKLRVSMDGGLNWLTPTVSGTSWNVTDPASHTSGWTIAAQAVDLAGNPGPLTTRTVTLDTTARPTGERSLVDAGWSYTGIRTSRPQG